GPQRTSDLLAPILLLAGHGAAVHTVKFSPGGELLLSGSHDKTLLLWETFGECKNVLTLKGHANAVVEAKPTSVAALAAASCPHRRPAATSASVSTTATRRPALPSPPPPPLQPPPPLPLSPLLRRPRRPAQPSAVCNPRPPNLAALAAAAAAAACHRRRHRRRPTPHAPFVPPPQVHWLGAENAVSASADKLVALWDVRPFCEGGRCEKLFLGAQHNYEKGLLKCAWSARGPADGARVACGSADHFVYVWDAATKRIKYKLPGHTGSINEVAFHPTQPILASCANDKHVYLGEI
ncbi:hypothetical protein EMIHUDRAFT_53698, partial [Emiliania huxleyi CCMP1516]|uniref:Uncharacterized protein n=2 Tax=Emiliania huxleyi TaxID=2903 RepID=A0A0D3IR20_EMIH1